MNDEAIILEYELTPEWERVLTSTSRVAGLEIPAYYIVSYVCFVAVCTIAFAAAGIALAVLSGAAPTGLRLLGSLGGVTGAILAMLWAGRISRLSCQDSKGFYEIGSQVRIVLGPKGVLLLGDGQDWHTSWKYLRDVRVRRNVLAIWSPFAVFALPVDQLPIPLETAMRKIEAWRKAAVE